MKKTKLKLNDLKIKSFKTQLNSKFTKTVKGGATQDCGSISVSNETDQTTPLECVSLDSGGILCTGGSGGVHVEKSYNPSEC